MPAEMQLLFLVALMALFWFLMIRPARKAQRAQQELLASLEVGHQVVLSSGIFGRVTSLEDATVGLEIAPGTVITVARQVVVRRVEDEIGQSHGTTEATGTGTGTVEEN